MNKDLITKAWKVSGKVVMEEFYKGRIHNYAERWRGYDQAWDEQVQNVAGGTQKDGSKLFLGHMSGGVSDIERGLQFIPRPGRKKKQQHSEEEDVGMEEGETQNAPEKYQSMILRIAQMTMRRRGSMGLLMTRRRLWKAWMNLP
eukprot:jgi/Picre1/35987/NNA_003444.t1